MTGSGKSASGLNHFTLSDFMNGLSMDFFVTLLDDVKFRDTSLKSLQYLLKLNAAVLTEYKMFEDNKEVINKLNMVSSRLSLARNCFRFLRWSRNILNLPSDLNQKNTLSLILKSIHHVASMCSAIFEDIATLGKLNIVDPQMVGVFELPATCAWFTESVTGVILQLRALQEHVIAFTTAKNRFIDLKTSSSYNQTELSRLNAECFNAFVKLHFVKMGLVKWLCETTSAAHDLGYHQNTKIAITTSLVSALISTYVQSAKFWPSNKL